jgi:hypothetical protein
MTMKALCCSLLLILVPACRHPNTQRESGSGIDDGVSKPRHFSNYQRVYSYIARNESFGKNDVSESDAFRIAADSRLDVCRPTGSFPPVYVITVHKYSFFNGNVQDSARGATAHGRFYLLIPQVKQGDAPHAAQEPEYDLVGIAAGSSYHWETVNNVPRFLTEEHEEGGRNKSVLQWNGRVFQKITSGAE